MAPCWSSCWADPEVEADSFDAKAGRVRDIGITQATYARIFFVALTLTASLATAIVYGFGGVAAVRGTLAVGTVVALTQYLTRLYGPLTQLSNLQLDVVTALVSFERLFEVLDIVPMIDEDPDAVDIPRGAVSIEFDDVDFTYPEREEVSLASLESVAVLESGLRSEVLHDVSFRVEPGQMVALVGPFGRGQDHDLVADPPPLRRHRGLAAARTASMCATPRCNRSATSSESSPRTRYLFHDTLRANLMYARPRRPKKKSWRPGPRPDRPPGLRTARRLGHRDRRTRLPALGRREAAGRPSPAHPQGT